jgi:hypothetical protein
MVKKIIIGILAMVVVVAAATSIYNTVSATSQSANQAVAAEQVDIEAQGEVLNANVIANGQGSQGRGGRQSSQGRGTGGEHTRTPNPQNELTEWVTYTGVVVDYAPPTFTLLTPDGQSIPAEPGNTNYISNLGLALENGDAVAVTGFWDTNGGLALKSLTIDSTGQSYIFRDEQGRPLWAGGRQSPTP